MVGGALTGAKSIMHVMKRIGGEGRTTPGKLLAGAALILWIIPALACNFPRAGDDAPRWLPSRTPTPLVIAYTEAPLESATPTQPGQPPDGLPPVPTITSQPGSGWGFPGLRPLSEFNEFTAGAGAVHHEPGVWNYMTQSGDTIPSLSARFGADPGQIHGLPDPQSGSFVAPGLPLSIPMEALDALPDWALLPDSAIPYGPSSAEFDLAGYILEHGGILAAYSEEVDEQVMSGEEIIERVALDTSTNPRLLLAFLEMRSGWVIGPAKVAATSRYPIGWSVEPYHGLYKELILTARFLDQGFYGWRSGRMTAAEFPGGGKLRMDPRVNAGTAAATILVTRMYRQATFSQALYGPEGFIATYWRMFGDPWQTAAGYEPVFNADFPQNLPRLELPFEAGTRWNFTSGPHITWGSASPWGALDFAPSGERSGCYVSSQWATAAAGGVITRSERGMVYLDTDGDSREQTGLVLLYLHMAEWERIPAGTRVKTGQPIGHPSCEGGVATGTHLHFARKYNGEWLRIGPEAPLQLSGWTAYAAERQYQGQLLSPDGGTVVTSRSDGSWPSLLVP